MELQGNRFAFEGERRTHCRGNVAECPTSFRHNSVILGLVLLLLSACQSPSPVEEQPPASHNAGTLQGHATLALEPCVLPGAPRPARCGTLRLPETGEKRGTLIPVRVTVLPATSAEKKSDPLFLLAGGPGQAASEAFGDALAAWTHIAAERDMVLVDVRGTGSSSPLDCALPKSLEAQLSIPLDELARACARKLRPKHNLAAFTTDAIVADLEKVRTSLGYQRINLLGVSYGSRLALRYAALHGSSVRSVVLDAVAPPELHMPGPFAADASTALRNVFAACAAQPACKTAFGDLNASLGTVLERLKSRPRVRLRHPRTGQPMELTVTPKLLLQSLRSLLYSPELAALIPLTVARAEKLEFQGLLAQLETLLSKSLPSMSHGLLLSITCAEDVHRIDADDQASAKATVMGLDLIDEFKAACTHWNVPPRSIQWPSSIQTPALLLSGGLDPVTPPRWAKVAAQRLPNAQHVIMSEAAHGISTRGCVPTLIHQFLNRQPLDTRCAKRFKRPAFFTSYAGPQP